MVTVMCPCCGRTDSMSKSMWSLVQSFGYRALYCMSCFYAVQKKAA